MASFSCNSIENKRPIFENYSLIKVCATPMCLSVSWDPFSIIALSECLKVLRLYVYHTSSVTASLASNISVVTKAQIQVLPSVIFATETKCTG